MGKTRITISAPLIFNKSDDEVDKPKRNRYVFTREQRSRGGTKARDTERACGKKLNHGWVYGKKVGEA